MTVDPARRLAHALGLGSLDDDPHPVPNAGPLEAAMLDQKRAWDRLIARHAPSPEAARRLLENRFYRDFSAQFAGTHEYLAVEQLCAAIERGGRDLIVLDTPPASHAFEFLDAPRRIDDLFDRRLLRWLLFPQRAGRFAGKTARFLVGELERAAGAQALIDLADFFATSSALFDSLERRGRELRSLLAAESTSLILVGAPDARGMRETRSWIDRMNDRGLPPAAVVINRVHPPIDGPADRAAILDALSRCGVLGDHAGWLADNLIAHQKLAAGEKARIAALRAILPGRTPLSVVPNLAADVHDLAGLAELGRWLAEQRVAAA
jgi:anion-transporting  ArsA/GET3 family ATPase